MLSAEADQVCGAEHGVTSPDRVNSRNGYRHRELDTRAGTVDVAIPKLRQASYFPEWLLKRSKRAEAALVRVVATCYLLRRVHPADGQAGAVVGITSLPKSQKGPVVSAVVLVTTEVNTRPAPWPDNIDD